MLCRTKGTPNCCKRSQFKASAKCLFPHSEGSQSSQETNKLLPGYVIWLTRVFVSTIIVLIFRSNVMVKFDGVEIGSGMFISKGN